MESDFYIGYSTDSVLRYKSSSGGIGGAFIKYLLSTSEYGTVLSFKYDRNTCQYLPYFAYSFDDYNNCGSIYQDVDVINYLKQNLEKIKSGIIVSCMPCHVKAVRSILERRKIKNFIISLCCSGQTSVQGTWCYYKFLGINKDDVEKIQYRGNGWPSGIQIYLEGGRVLKYDNYSYPWNIIHSSLLFRPKRCLSCTFKTVADSDVNLADPWLKEYEDTDTIGNSIIILNTDIAKITFEKMSIKHCIYSIKINNAKYLESQKGTVELKKDVKNHKRFIKLIKCLSDSTFYLRIVMMSPRIMIIHNKVCRWLYNKIQ